MISFVLGSGKTQVWSGCYVPIEKTILTISSKICNIIFRCFCWPRL